MNNKLSGTDRLTARIKELEMLQEQQMESIKYSASGLLKSLTPANLLKNSLRSVIETPGLRSTAFDTAISAGAGLLGKNLFVRSSRNIFKRLAGTAIQFVVSNYVRNKIPNIRENIAADNGVEK